jgi:Ni,Fe-hydrogenase III small subunit
MLNNIKILWHQGKQYIPDVTTAQVPGIFRGRPIITDAKAISTNPVSIDLGKCTFCGECAIQFPGKISFTKDYKLSSNDRERLIIKEGDDQNITLNPDLIRSEIHRLFGRSLKLRQVSAGGDNSCEWELNSSNNVQFDMSRFGIDFVASPRHADGIVITGPITENMAKSLAICYNAVPSPKIIILAGTDAISGGIFAGSPALNREFITKHTIDLYVPGNPIHPLTFINGVLSLLKKKG